MVGGLSKQQIQVTDELASWPVELIAESSSVQKHIAFLFPPLRIHKQQFCKV